MAGIEQEQEHLMMSLITMLTGNAWMLLGKRANPVSGKEQVDLAGARYFINTLGALKDRTEGKLTQREQFLLESELTNLRLNYVDVLKNAPKEKPAEHAAEAAEPEPKE